MAASSPSYGPRPWTFYVLAALFALFVIFLYGPMIAVLILSFQGPSASLVFPLIFFPSTNPAAATIRRMSSGAGRYATERGR